MVAPSLTTSEAANGCHQSGLLGFDSVARAAICNEPLLQGTSRTA